MLNSSLELNLSLRTQETSKDSNWSLITLNIKNGKIIITKTYGGFMAQENTSVEKNIIPEQEQKIINYLKDKNLMNNITEKKATNGIGIASFLLLEIFKPKSSRIVVEGKTKIWGSDEYVEREWGSAFVKSRTNLEHGEYISGAEAFVSFVEGV